MLCNIEGIPLKYHEIGTGKPILAIHGWNENAKTMYNRLEKSYKIPKNFRRVYIDLPGHGQTPTSPKVQSSNDILRIINKFTKRVFENENFLIIGLSYGAYIARGLIYCSANHIDGVCMLVPLIFADPLERTVPHSEVLVNKISNREQGFDIKKEIIDLLTVRNSKTLYQINEYMKIVESEPGNIDFREKIHSDTSRYEYPFNVNNIENVFNKPTLIITGRQDDLVGYEDAWSLLHLYPRATFSVLDRTGHLLEDQDNNIAQLIGEWLLRVTDFNKTSTALSQ